MLEIANFIAELDLFQWAGLAGFALYVSVYACVELRKMHTQSVRYCALNALAAILIGVSLIGDFNLTCAFIQGVWLLTAVSGLLLRWKKSPFYRPTLSGSTAQFGAIS